MNRFVRLLEAFHSSRQLDADRMIRRHWYLVEQARAYEQKQNTGSVRNNVAGTPQLSHSDGVIMRSANINADVSDITVQRRRFEQRNDDYKDVLVVASAWLLFYGVALAGFALTQGSEMLASLY